MEDRVRLELWLDGKSSRKEGQVGRKVRSEEGWVRGRSGQKKVGSEEGWVERRLDQIKAVSDEGLVR
jgi:hypothetical protein